ncbi:precorrin-6Y C5,15-methyltransferase (decarboxylating) subunit CbiT [Methanocalculus taiwanensis]|uniref:Precorrin-6Y C5,15-methyltransferase (Decarboxylating) subunit CbiT n=1 Tax=Methanocalculus taiwanensis TaxID=106207 RepID=A0ABD4TMY2_9EURY|nr:precorrin-6Y C5,15-methyltransferase (decarboxylating) subunit CbiT [Methanocalculus taiwanensis]MCQ1539129.1 precorrin-6Y C5,15-methyltransferase (decarboxylating) subunit CbiT [Methanocalculus taiwanensis]
MTTSELKGGPTQPEICAVAVDKLGIRPGDTVADIGCGTGTVSIAIARTAQRVYAIDIRPEAITVAEDTIAKSGLTNITLIEDDACSFLQESERIDLAFVGGSKGLPRILLLLAEKRVRTIVVNAVLIETATSAINTMRALGIFAEAIHLQVSRSHDLAGKTMFKPENPIYIIVGRCVSY